MPLPVSHSLIGASLAALMLPQTSSKRNWLVLLGAAFLANVPDFDFFLVWGVRLDANWHRGLTHSIFFAFSITCLMLAGMGLTRLRYVLAGGAALMSHAVLDFLTTRRGGGVELFYPFSNDRLKLGIFSVSEFERGFYFTELVSAGSIELVICTPIFLAVLWIKGYFSHTA